MVFAISDQQLWRRKTTSPPFTVNAVMKKRAGWGLGAATTRTCCTQLACCRGTVWLSCLLLFRSEDKAVSEGTVPGKQAPTLTPTPLFIYTEAHNCGVPPHLACSEPNVHPLKQSFANPYCPGVVPMLHLQFGGSGLEWRQQLIEWDTSFISFGSWQISDFMHLPYLQELL